MTGPRRLRPGRLLAVPVALLLVGCGGDEGPDVRTAAVERADVVEVVEAPGTVVAKAAAAVSAPADGTVAELQVSDGDTVAAGDVLLRVDSPTAERTLEQAREADAEAAQAASVDLPGLGVSAEQSDADAAAQEAFTSAREAAAAVPEEQARSEALAAVAAAEAQYAAARASARDAARRLDEGVGSLSEALSALGAAQRVQTRAALAAAERTVEALVVRAPIGGVVSLGAQPDGAAAGGLEAALAEVPEGLRGAAGSVLGTPGGSDVSGDVTLGAPVSSGQQVATITDVSSVSLAAEVDETDVLLVEPGTEAEAELDAVPGATYPATVTSVAVSPTTSVRGGVSYVVRLSIGAGSDLDGAPAPEPRPGMSAVVDLRVAESLGTVAVPASAVLRDQPQTAVWLVRDGVASRREVRLGAEGEDLVEVRRGLQEGDVVVVSGADAVTAGDEVP